MSPPGCSFSLRTSSTMSPLSSDEFSHSTSFRVFETTYFGSAFIRSAKPSSRGADGQNAAQIWYVTRPSRSASTAKSSSIL
jgi:hypothetical protein